MTPIRDATYICYLTAMPNKHYYMAEKNAIYNVLHESTGPYRRTYTDTGTTYRRTNTDTGTYKQKIHRRTYKCGLTAQSTKGRG